MADVSFLRRAGAAGSSAASAVDEAERKVGAVLGDLEADVGGEVKDVVLEDVVDTDPRGRPEVKKAVKIRLEPAVRKTWSR